MSKSFVMDPSQREQTVKMKPEEIQKYLKDDGYNQYRLNIWNETLTVHKYEELLKPVEATIEQLKNKIKSETRPIHQWEPFEDRVIIKPDAAPTVSKGGVLLTEQSQENERPATGTIFIAGPGIPSKTVLKRRGYLVNGNFQEQLAEGETGEAVFMPEIMPLKPGDRVMYSKQGGLKIKDPNAKNQEEYYLLMRVTDIFIKV